MTTARGELLDAINLAEARRDVAARDRPGVWWARLRHIVDMLKKHPLTKDLVSQVPVPDRETILYSLREIPDDFSEWGRRAWAFVEYIESKRPEVRGQSNQGIVEFDFPVGSHDMYKLMATWMLDKQVKGDAILAMDLYVRPILDWLRSEITAAAVLEHAVERWVQRTELFGIASRGEDEAAMQDDLHRFLFDQGLDPLEINREYDVARGRVDFLLRTGEPVPVELKVWRSKGAQKLSPWTYQARTYATGLRMTRAYLVVVNTSDEARVVPDFQVHEPLKHQGVDLHLRLVDTGRHATSKDHDKRKPVSVSRADLGLV